MSSPQLPDDLAYLQPVLDAFAALPPDELHEDTDISHLEEVVRLRIADLSFEDAEERIETDQQLLRYWLNGPGKESSPAHFILAWLNPFIVAELHDDA